MSKPTNEFKGEVVKHVITKDDGVKYSVLEISNHFNLNYRLFVPGTERRVGSKVVVSIRDGE